MEGKILITGASGFIGGFIVAESLRRGLEVYAGVRSTSSREYLQDERIQFLTMDLSSPEKLSKQFAEHRFDYFIHNAGTITADSKEAYINVNCNYTKNILNALIDANSIPQKFTFISSIAAYGPADHTEDGYLTESHKPAPITAYGESKLLAEQFLKTQQKVPYTIIRPTAVYGPREKDIFIFVKMINRHLEAYIGSKKQDLTFIHVKDLVHAILDTTLSPLKNRAYFITDGNTYSQQDLGGIIKRLLNKRTLKINIPIPLVRGIAFLLEKSFGLFGKTPALNQEKINEIESLSWKCDIQPLKADVNFFPLFDLEKGMAETIAWYKNNHWV